MSYLASQEIPLEKRLAVSNLALAFAEAVFAEREAHANYVKVVNAGSGGQEAYAEFERKQNLAKVAESQVRFAAASALEYKAAFAKALAGAAA